MRFYLDLKYQLKPHDDVDEFITRMRRDAILAIDGAGDWTRSVGRDFELLIKEMVTQLPEEDADRFLRTVDFGFRSSGLETGMTVSVLQVPLAEGATGVRLRVRILTLAELEAKLPTIGLMIANLLLRKLPYLAFAAMMIWKDRNRKPVLEGDMRPRRTRREVTAAAASSVILFILSAVALLALFTGALVQDGTGFTLSFLRSDALDWFKRLVGPLFWAAVTALTLILLEIRKDREPTAFWRLDAVRTSHSDRHPSRARTKRRRAPRLRSGR
ncbi:hypothetical protein ACFP2T_09685 [Plantactinospora solaniradicis]|uniref:Uncharacterized protein n=1 Tax=Plantactinospora solaniradicis TaxID=1723736 RepID=A0ABW1K413_9ACTN